MYKGKIKTFSDLKKKLREFITIKTAQEKYNKVP